MTTPNSSTALLGRDASAFVLLTSKLRLDLRNPDPQAWTDGDLAEGLSRTMRWGGASRWAHPLSVAQHSLTVVAIREAEGPLSSRKALRELLHDGRGIHARLGLHRASESAQLGEPFRQLEAQRGRSSRRRLRGVPRRRLEPNRHGRCGL